MAINASKLEQELAQFTGTEHYYKLYPKLYLTDGTKYLAEQAECFWLFDLFWSHLASVNEEIEPFTVLIIAVLNSSATIGIEDGNGKMLASQYVEYTDFLLPVLHMYGCWNGDAWIAMLTSEY